MFMAVKVMMQMIFKILMIPSIALALVVMVFMVAVFLFYKIEYRKGRRLKPGSVRRPMKRNLLIRLFYDAPKQYVDDMYERDGDFFAPQGMIIFTGRQGAGKTVALMQYAMDLRYQYPKAKVISNTKCNFMDVSLKHWRQLINYKNGQSGVIAIMDELQNWFNSNSSRNFPPEMLSVITQNRKNRRVILGTAQNYHLLAKAIRGQATEIRQCLTLAGVVTIVTRREPIIDEEGTVVKLKYLGMYCFVHTRQLRDAYDTWAVVESLSDKGFSPNPYLNQATEI